MATDSGELQHVVSGSIKTQLDRVMDDMLTLGIVTELAGKVVGGVALSTSYYQHMLATEGRVDELPACQLFITRRCEQHLQLLPATQTELQQGQHHLPQESAVLSKMMSPAAVTELHWSRVPAVIIFGCFKADKEELEEAAAAGIPISPSLSGPHAEEQTTQMEVFFKQFKYPEHKCFILRDWGFVICGADLPDAMQCFNVRLKETLVTSSEAADVVPDGTEQFRLSERSSVTGAVNSNITSDGKPLIAVLSNAFKRLQESMGLLRTQSEPPPDMMMASCPTVDSIKAQFTGMSEPSSPMVGTDTLPDHIRTISIASRRQSSDSRVPSIQAGLRPW